MSDFDEYPFEDFEETSSPLRPPHRYEPEDPTVCDNCGSRESIEMTPSHTAYEEPVPNRFDRALEERPLSRNRPTPLCPGCAKDHNEYWDEMWKDYYGSRL